MVTSCTHYIFAITLIELSKIEIEKVLDARILTLTENRLRAETAVISTATAISLL